MSSRERLLEDLKAAAADLGIARRSLADAQFRARHGMENCLMLCASAEHTAYHRWLRADAAYNAAH